MIDLKALRDAASKATAINKCGGCTHRTGCRSLMASLTDDSDCDFSPSKFYPVPFVASPSTVMALLDTLSTVKEAVDAQANDEGLWFTAKTAQEAYLQQELRKLHEIIENALAELEKGK